MRELRVLGISEDGQQLWCGSTEPHEHTSFILPIDERLQAALRGDASRFGQLEIDMEPQLRPREIQRRIRAGASVEQVAAAAGCGADRIERYAYPVLMERASMAEQAQAVRPLEGAALGSAAAAQADRTLAEIATATLTERGQHQSVQWDAFRDERGWTVTLTWHAGRSENRAEWAFTPRPGGGTVTARNAEAADLVEPRMARLRTVGGAGPAAGEDSEDARRAAGRSATVTPAMTADEHLVAGTVTDERAGSRGTRPTTEAHGHGDRATEQQAVGDRAVADRAVADRGRQETRRTGTDDGAVDAATSTRHSAGRSARRGHKPPMPSWEDVLLGTRSAQK